MFQGLIPIEYPIGVKNAIGHPERVPMAEGRLLIPPDYL
jgi:hypothetical protein